MDLVGSGHEMYVGLGQETVYGTAVSPTVFMRVARERHKHNTGAFSAAGTLGGHTEREAMRGVPTVEAAQLEGPAFFDGNHFLLKYGCGDYSDTSALAGGAYVNRYRIGRYLPSVAGVLDATNTSLTAWIARGSVSNLAYIYQYKGYLFSKLGLSIARDGMRWSTDGLFQDSSPAGSAPAFTMPTSYSTKAVPWPTTLEIDVTGVSSTESPTMTAGAITPYGFTLDIDHGLAQDYPLGMNGGTNYPLPLAPHREAENSVLSGTMEILAGLHTTSFAGIGTLRTIQDQGLPLHLRVTIYGETITGSTRYSRILHLRRCYIDDIHPSVEDTRPIRRMIKFKAFDPTLTGHSPLFWIETNTVNGAA